MEWEYATERIVFVGPRGDDWPYQRRWRSLVDDYRQRKAGTLGRVMTRGDMPEGEEAEELRERYLQWRDSAEQGWLNDMGAAGFELISVFRDEDWGGRDLFSMRSFPVVIVQP